MELQWKQIEGYVGYYVVSNTGLVKSVPRSVRDRNRRSVRFAGGFRKLQTTHQGYKQVSLDKNGVGKKFLVHRLVAMAFIPNPGGKANVNHIDGIKDNNNVENLGWVTSSENRKHAYATGLLKAPYKGKFGKHHNRSKTIYRLDKSGNNIIAIYHGSHEASRKLGISYKLIARVASGERKSTHGMHFVYKDNLLKAEPTISDYWIKG